jgi:hypothetical protein
MIRAILFVSALAYVASSSLVQANRFGDRAAVRIERATVLSSDVTYRPFRVDWLRVSFVDGSERRVPVLPRIATSAGEGSSMEVAVGRGLLRKEWIAAAEEHRAYDTMIYRVVYLGIFAALFAMLTWVYYWKGAPKVHRHGVFAAAIVLGAVCFYAF